MLLNTKQEVFALPQPLSVANLLLPLVSVWNTASFWSCHKLPSCLLFSAAPRLLSVNTLSQKKQKPVPGAVPTLSLPREKPGVESFLLFTLALTRGRDCCQVRARNHHLCSHWNPTQHPFLSALDSDKTETNMPLKRLNIGAVTHSPPSISREN